MHRQKYFYHASPECDLKYIEPRRRTLPRNFKEGEVVFATPEISFATMFLVPHDDSWANGGAFNNTPYFVISDKERFLQADKGGCIYSIRSDSFKKMNNFEWFSKKKIRISGKITFSSGFMAMIVMGVHVYVVDSKTFTKIQNARDHGVSVLNSMESENEKLGFNVQKLQMYFSSKKLIQESTPEVTYRAA